MKIKCAYCYLQEGRDIWFNKESLELHLGIFHPFNEFRTIDDLLNSWKILGTYEEVDV